jgi:hypothetical protein
MRRWTPRQALVRAVELARNQGLKVLWIKILGETVYRRVLFIEDVLNRPLPPLESIPKIDLSELRENEIDQYLSLRPDHSAEETSRRLRSGHRCWVTRDHGRVVSALWLVTGRAFIRPLGCEISLAPDEIYGYDSFTDPGDRGQHLPAARARLIRPMLEAEGFRRRLSVAVPEDLVAMSNTRRNGFRPIGTMGYFRVGPWRRYFVRPHGADSIPTPLTPSIE